MDDESAGPGAVFELLHRPGVAEMLVALRAHGGTATMNYVGARWRLSIVRQLAAAGFVSVGGSLDDPINPAMPVSLTEAGYDATRALTDGRPRPHWVFALRAWTARRSRR